ncbi:hypothetical protein D3C72_2074150 [compost metagenome]
MAGSFSSDKCCMSSFKGRVCRANPCAIAISPFKVTPFNDTEKRRRMLEMSVWWPQ